MKTCTCCKAALVISDKSRPRPVRYDILYGIMFDCECGSTQFHVLWRLPDEMLAEVPAVEAA